MKFVNLTPHNIRIFGESGKEILTIPVSGIVARVKMNQVLIKRINGIPVYKSIPSHVEGLPEPEEGTVYIVSPLVAQSVNREDVVAPNTSPESVVRDDEGNVAGFKGFQMWAKSPEEELDELISMKGDKIYCYNCGKDLYTAFNEQGGNVPVAVLWVDTGHPGSRYEPPEPAVTYFECWECFRRRRLMHDDV